jgi:hypothetical protein
MAQDRFNRWGIALLVFGVAVVVVALFLRLA